MNRKPRITTSNKSLKFGNLVIGLDKTFRLDNDIITFVANVTTGDGNNVQFVNVRSMGEWVAYCEGGGGITGGGGSGTWCSVREERDSVATDTVIGSDSGGFWVSVTFNGSTASRTKIITITETETEDVIELIVNQNGQPNVGIT